MSDVQTTRHIKKSLKHHRCDHCHQNIPTGSPYTKTTGINDGYPFTCKAHNECDEAYKKFNKDSTDWEWFELHESNEFPYHQENIRKLYNLREVNG